MNVSAILIDGSRTFRTGRHHGDEGGTRAMTQVNDVMTDDADETLAKDAEHPSVKNPPTIEFKDFNDAARQIHADHEEVIRGFKHSLGHAIHAGRLLLHVKGLLAHGTFIPWVEGSTGLSVRTAQVYMQLATNAQSIALLKADSISDALRTIARKAEKKETDESGFLEPVLRDYACPFCGYEWDGPPRSPKPDQPMIGWGIMDRRPDRYEQAMLPFLADEPAAAELTTPMSQPEAA